MSAFNNNTSQCKWSSLTLLLLFFFVVFFFAACNVVRCKAIAESAHSNKVLPWHGEQKQIASYLIE